MIIIRSYTLHIVIKSWANILDITLEDDCCYISKQGLKLGISPLVLQVGCRKKQNSLKNSIFYISHCFTGRIEKTWKGQPKMTQFCWNLDIFEDCSILPEKQQLKPRKWNSLMNFASFDAHLDPQVTSGVKWIWGQKIFCVILLQWFVKFLEKIEVFSFVISKELLVNLIFSSVFEKVVKISNYSFVFSEG